MILSACRRHPLPGMPGVTARAALLARLGFALIEIGRLVCASGVLPPVLPDMELRLVMQVTKQTLGGVAEWPLLIEVAVDIGVRCQLGARGVGLQSPRLRGVAVRVYHCGFLLPSREDPDVVFDMSRGCVRYRFVMRLVTLRLCRCVAICRLLLLLEDLEQGRVVVEGRLFALVGRASGPTIRLLVGTYRHGEGAAADGLGDLLSLQREYRVRIQPGLLVIEAELTVRVLSPGPEQAVLVSRDAEGAADADLGNVGVNDNPGLEEGTEDAGSPEVELSAGADGR